MGASKKHSRVAFTVTVTHEERSLTPWRMHLPTTLSTNIADPSPIDRVWLGAGRESQRHGIRHVLEVGHTATQGFIVDIYL